MKKLTIIFSLCSTFLLVTSCANHKLSNTGQTNPGRTSLVYKMDIDQGNYLKEENVQKLQQGMTKEQVIQTIGSPLLQDPFHEDRWDYTHTLYKRGKLKEEHKLTLHFKDGFLERLERSE